MTKPFHIWSLSFFLWFSTSVHGQTTWPSPSGSLIDVSNTVYNASVLAGHTVTIPADTNVWTSRLIVTKAITIKGAGTSDSSRTVIIYGIPTANSGACLTLSGVAGRITDIFFTATNTVPVPSFGIVSVSQTSYQPWRIDHCVFKNVRSRGILFSGYESGLIDHCLFLQDTVSAEQGIRIEADNATSWTRGPNWGSITNVVVEDCSFPWPGPGDSAIEGYKGERAIIRFNYFLNNSGFGMHGMDSQNLPNRGTYSVEYYGNTNDITTTGVAKIMVNRGGTTVVYSNKVTAVSSFAGYHIALDSYRFQRDFYWLPLESPNTHWRQGDKWIKTFSSAAGVYYTNAIGYHTGASGTLVLEDSTKSWAPNQWLGGVRIVNVTDNSVSTASITASTATTATVAAFSGGALNTWSTGDMYHMTTGGKPCDGSSYIDMNFPWWYIHGIGTGSGSTLTDSTKSWTNNALIGLKVWNLTDNSKGPITANNATTATATLAGGLVNTWTAGDEYVITPASGTVTSGTNPTNFTDSAQSWVSSQFVDMYCWNRTTSAHGRVKSNDATTLEVYGLEGGTRRDFQTGDEYVITQGYPPLDAVGRVGPTRWFGPGEVPVSNWNSANVSHHYSPLAYCYEWENWCNGTTNIQNTADGNHFDSGVSPTLFDFIKVGDVYFNDTVKPGYTPLAYPHPSISTEPPGAITAIYPTNNAVDVPLTITLSWSCTGATSYDLFMDADDPPVTQLANDQGSSTFDLFPLANDTTYFWRVVASNLNGSSTNSFSFRTTAAAPPPPPPSSGNPRGNGRRRTNF